MKRINDVQNEEKITPIIACATTMGALFDIDRYSSLNKLSRVVAYLLRFKNNSLCKRNNIPQITGPLNLDEILTAIKSLDLTANR